MSVPRAADSSRSLGPSLACSAARRAAPRLASRVGASGSSRASRLTTQAARVGLRSAPIRFAAAASPAVLAAAASALRRSVKSCGSAPYSSAAASITRPSAALPGPAPSASRPRRSSGALLPTYRSCPVAKPREQIVFRQRRAGRVSDPDEVLIAERGLADVARELAEPRVLDLAAVREQRLALAAEHRADVDRRGDPFLGHRCPALALLVRF